MAFRTSLGLAASALALALAACATPPAPGAVVDARTPTEQFKAEVTSRPEEIRLALHGQGLSAPQADALAAFVDGWRQAEGGPVLLQSPTNGPDNGAAFRTGESTRGFLISQGVPAQQIRVVGYDAAGDARAPLIVGYLRHEVAIPRCGLEWGNISRSMDNKPQSNFGCAVTANIAAQLANPADLLGPQPMDPADAGRRIDVLGKYREGQPTATTRDEQAVGAVSTTVK